MSEADRVSMVTADGGPSALGSTATGGFTLVADALVPEVDHIAETPDPTRGRTPVVVRRRRDEAQKEPA